MSRIDRIAEKFYSVFYQMGWEWETRDVQGISIKKEIKKHILDDIAQLKKNKDTICTPSGRIMATIHLDEFGEQFVFSLLDETIDEEDWGKPEQRQRRVKLLKKSRRKLDDSITEILPYNKYLNVTDTQISLKIESIDEIKKKINAFEDLLNNEKLVYFDRNNQNEYYHLLYNPGECGKK